MQGHLIRHASASRIFGVLATVIGLAVIAWIGYNELVETFCHSTWAFIGGSRGSSSGPRSGRCWRRRPDASRYNAGWPPPAIDTRQFGNSRSLVRCWRMRVIESTEAAQAHVRGGETKSVLVPTMGALHRWASRADSRCAGARWNGWGSRGQHFCQSVPIRAGFGFRKVSAPGSGATKNSVRQRAVNLLFRPQRHVFRQSLGLRWRRSHCLAGLCGAARPGHFRGVCTVVAKLFNLARAYRSGLRRERLSATRDHSPNGAGPEFFRSRSLGVPTVRAEADGLALSSRNQYLNRG